MGGHLINQCLHSSGPVDVQGDIYQPWQDLGHHDLQNLRVRSFDYLLAEIVTELVRHDISEDWHHAMHEAGVEYSIDLRSCTCFINWV